jgi:hypothetical protein
MNHPCLEYRNEWEPDFPKNVLIQYLNFAKRFFITCCLVLKGCGFYFVLQI